MFSLLLSMNHRGFLRISALAALLAGAMASKLLAAAEGDAALQAVVQSPNGSRLRVEAPEAHIVRVWLKPAGEFTRQPSLALESAPATRIPLTKTEDTGTVTVGTGSLTVRIDRQTLRFEVAAADGTLLMADAQVAMTIPEAAWTLTHTLDAGEKLFGLGQDNQNNGRLNRRGVNPRALGRPED